MFIPVVKRRISNSAGIYHFIGQSCNDDEPVMWGKTFLVPEKGW